MPMWTVQVVVALEASVAVTVYAVEGEVEEGVPEMTPDPVLRVRPAGRAGDTEYETALPVVSEGVLVTAWPTSNVAGLARPE